MVHTALCGSANPGSIPGRLPHIINKNQPSLETLNKARYYSRMNLQLELKKLGLSDKESLVYLSLLELGQASVQDIARKANVKRATTYVVLDALVKRGIVSTIEEGKKLHYAAEDPRALQHFFRTQEAELKEKEEEFKKALPELDALLSLSGKRPSVRYYEGKNGIRAMREDLLLSGVTEDLNIYSLDEMRELFSAEEEAEWVRRRAESGLKVRVIYTSKNGIFTGFKSKSERRFVPYETFPLSCDIDIYGNRLSITTLHGKLITVIIENQEIADTMRLVFELAWIGSSQFPQLPKTNSKS